MDAGGWAPLLEDEDQRTLLAPLFIISMSSDAIEDGGQHAKAVTQAIDILPNMVSVIDGFWNPPQRSPPSGSISRACALQSGSLRAGNES